MEKTTQFHGQLRETIDKYINEVYDTTVKFPKDEIFGVTSQLRRAALSVMLNYVEGFARKRPLVYKNFLEIAYGSLKESKYLIYFSFKRKYLDQKVYKDLNDSGERIGAMLWGIISKL